MGEQHDPKAGSETPADSIPLGFVTASVGELVASGFRDALAPHGVSPRQYAVLWAIAAYGEHTQHQLSERLGIPASRVVALIDDLERRSAVRRLVSERDRRIRTVLPHRRRAPAARRTSRHGTTLRRRPHPRPAATMSNARSAVSSRAWGRTSAKARVPSASGPGRHQSPRRHPHAKPEAPGPLSTDAAARCPARQAAAASAPVRVAARNPAANASPAPVRSRMPRTGATSTRATSSPVDDDVGGQRTVLDHDRGRDGCRDRPAAREPEQRGLVLVREQHRWPRCRPRGRARTEPRARRAARSTRRRPRRRRRERGRRRRAGRARRASAPARTRRRAGAASGRRRARRCRRLRAPPTHRGRDTSCARRRRRRGARPSRCGRRAARARRPRRTRALRRARRPRHPPRPAR